MAVGKCFVLVHGTSCGGWIWQRVAPLLRARGHDVFTPTLTGMGERSHLGAGKVDYDTHLKDILSVLEYEDLAKVVLVGHSYAGMVITDVAAREVRRIERLIYLDAYRAESGRDSGGPVARRRARAGPVRDCPRKAKPRSPRDDRGSG